jgi:hypothetical protein
MAKSFGLENVSPFFSQPGSFDELIRGDPRPDSTSIFSENLSIMLWTHHQCRAPSSSSAVPSQAQPAAKQQVVLLFVSVHGSICEGPSPVTKFQMKNVSEDIEYG